MGCLGAAEVMPPAPAHYFNDYANVISAATESELNLALETFEKETSNQIVVAIFPKMDSDSSIEDYTVRVAEKWHVGQKGKNNGAVLFVFINDRKMFIQVGYGLEGALPDGLTHLIIQNEIVPRFKQQDYDGGMKAAVNAMMAATRGEYKGNGSTSNDEGLSGLTILFIVLIVAFFLWLSSRGKRGRSYGGGGYTTYSSGWSGSSGGGGGGFSGGGGSFGGGGSGGSW